MKSTPYSLRSTLASFIGGLLVCSASVSYADDTEIFFGGPSIDDGVRPNVLFILDNSGSMAWSTTDQDPPNRAGEVARMQVLKDSFATIINQAGAINAGIMVLNSRSEYNNTRMVYPVSYLNDPLPSSVQQVASTPQIMVSGDDATQWSTATSAVIDEPNLPMGQFVVPGNANTTQTLTAPNAFVQIRTGSGWFFDPYVDRSCMLDSSLASTPRNSGCSGINATQLGLDQDSGGTALMYFPGLAIPAGSTVASATLTIYPQNDRSSGFDPRISVESNKTSAPFNDSNSISGRNFTTWRDLPDTAWTSGTPVVLNITQEINNLRGVSPTTAEVSNLALRLYGNHGNERIICMRTGTGCTADELPVLNITYTSTTPSARSRDAALRFQNVGIPQGATITSARIDFVPVTSSTTPVTFQIRAENDDDADVFTNTTNLALRSKGAALVTWDAENWQVSNPPTHVEGPNVTSLVQSVVSQSNWCGNNAMAFHFSHSGGSGSRTAYSIDGATGLQPTLTVTYTGGDGGCLNPIIEASVIDANDDAYENNNEDMTLTGTNLPVSRRFFAARFAGVPLVNSAEIIDAQVIVTPANTVTSPSASTSVRFENSSNAQPFTVNDEDIQDRSDTTSMTCSFTSWTAGTPVTCTGSTLTSGLQTVVRRSGWTPGNALAIIFEQDSNSTLQVKAYENNPAQAIKLRIKVRNGGLASSTYTVRQHLNALVQAMNADGNTPVIPTYNEAAQYLRGEISGYNSPITSSCQPTHVVLLTDGQANVGRSTAEINAHNNAKTNIASWAGSCSTPLVTTGDDPGFADNTNTDEGERCGRKLAEWLALTDQSTLGGDSFINTHTIGFALDVLDDDGPQTFLNEVADNGNGGAYEAGNTSELTKAFSDILKSVQDVDTSFVSASAPVNSFERQNNKDELYFSLFSPELNNRWPGNLKRYRFATVDDQGNLDPRIVDQVGRDAVDLDTGRFSSAARSFWSSQNDGNDTTAGGAASKLPVAASRNLYTYIGNSPAGTPTSLSGHQINSTNVTKAMLGNASMSDTTRNELIDYIRGLEGSTQRKSIGAPIHSSPRLATYSCITPNSSDSSKCDVDDQTAFVGSNEGFVHAFNTSTGVEQFAFMPEELLDNISKLKANASTSSSNPLPYGMDSPVTLWVNDANGDGKVLDNATDTSPQTGEFVYAYATMGRGGRGVYALDVTVRSNPKMLWYIKGGETPGFAKLGQTWSTPIKTKIRIGTTITDVLIFGGGYDTNQDNVRELSADSMGNAIYVVNAKTGALIWSASNETANASASQGHRTLSKMLYSIPANLRVIDLQTAPTGVLVSDPDKLADQIFVGDMGGQVWRFHINNGQTGANLISAGGSSSDGVFANVLPSNYSSLDLLGKRTNLRRFYNEPDVALLNSNGKLSLSVNIGSGWRGHPLNTDALDRFYSLRTSNLTDPSGGEGTLTESDLLDVTSNLSPTAAQLGTLDLSGDDPNDVSDDLVKGGWYISFSANAGEKVLTRALTAGSDNTLFFSTYEPASGVSNSCEPSFGTARGYAVNLLDGSPYEIADPNNPSANDRFQELAIPGIPPQPELICIGDQCFVIKGPGDIEEVEMPKLGKMYWIDRTDVD